LPGPSPSFDQRSFFVGALMSYTNLAKSALWGS